jgi:hypothetical protein
LRAAAILRHEKKSLGNSWLQVLFWYCGLSWFAGTQEAGGCRPFRGARWQVASRGWQMKYGGESREQWLCGIWFVRSDYGIDNGDRTGLPTCTEFRSLKDCFLSDFPASELG